MDRGARRRKTRLLGMATPARRCPTKGGIISQSGQGTAVGWTGLEVLIGSHGRIARRETRMALRVELKPGERIIIGESLITNSDSRAAFLIDGDAPILREEDILTAEPADTPVKRVYLCVQMMYLEKDIPKYQEIY